MATLVDDSTSPDEPDPSLILMLTASNLPSSWHWSHPLHDLQQILTPHMYTHTHTHRIFEPWLMYLHSSSGPALSNDFWMIAWWVNAEWICEGIKKNKTKPPIRPSTHQWARRSEIFLSQFCPKLPPILSICFCFFECLSIYLAALGLRGSIQDLCWGWRTFSYGTLDLVPRLGMEPGPLAFGV